MHQLHFQGEGESKHFEFLVLIGFKLITEWHLKCLFPSPTQKEVYFFILIKEDIHQNLSD